MRLLPPARTAVVVVLCLTAGTGIFSTPARGQAEADDEAFLKAWLADFDRTASKLVALAETIPADDYAWRPAPAVRSVAEVYTHVMGTNLFLAGALGSEPPDDMPASLTSIDQKAEVLQHLQLTLDHVRRAVERTRGRNLGRAVKMGRNRDSTVGEVILLVNGHAHEHLGQLVAYARSRDVTPPWSGGGDGS